MGFINNSNANSGGGSGGGTTNITNNISTTAGKFNARASTALALGRAVLLIAGDEIRYADKSTKADSLVDGLILQTYATADMCEVYNDDVVSCAAWSFVVGQNVWLGNLGVLTQIIPTTGEHATLVGIATDVDEMKINIKYLGKV